MVSVMLTRDVISDRYLDSYNDTSTRAVSDPSPASDVVDEPYNLRNNLDLACSITGLYRILDLINEQGSGGLGDSLCHGQ